MPRWPAPWRWAAPRIAPVRHSTDGVSEPSGRDVDDGMLAGLIDRDAGAPALAHLPAHRGRLRRSPPATPASAAGLDLAIVVGTEHGDFRSSAEFADGFLRRGPTGLSPMIFPNTVMNAMALGGGHRDRREGAVGHAEPAHGGR